MRVLSNPRYAGVYVYGRRRYRRAADGRKKIQRKHDSSDWLACIPNAHPGYISWEQYQQNLKLLEANGRGYELARGSPMRQAFPRPIPLATSLVGTNFGMTGPHLTPLLPSTQELALSFLMPPQAPSRDETRFHLVNPQFWAPPLYDEPALDALSFSTCSPLCTPGCCVLIVTNRDGQGTDEARSYEVFLNGKKVVSAAHSRSAQAPVNLLRSNALKVILDGGPPLQNIRFDRL